MSFSSTPDMTLTRGTSFHERYNDSNGMNDKDAAYSQMMIKEIRYEELDIGRVIGEGSFGIVHFGVWRGMSVAVKALKITAGFSSFASHVSSGEQGQKEKEKEKEGSMSSTDDEFLRHEAKLMARVCNHDHVIQFVGIVVQPCPCVVTIFCAGGSVEDLLVTSEYRQEVAYSTVVRMALEAARGILHLHLEGVIHRDLAARNLLLDSNLHVRVGDFGFSRVKAAAVSKGYTKSDMGPIRWLAPEAMRKKTYSEASDVFSFGVVCCCVLCVLMFTT
jgi:serine/threonine protein kinase